MINLTASATNEIKSIIQQQFDSADQNNQEVKPMYLRVGVKGGGCSGFSYSLDLTEDKGENDEEYDQNGVTVIRLIIAKTAWLAMRMSIN